MQLSTSQISAANWSKAREEALHATERMATSVIVYDSPATLARQAARKRHRHNKRSNSNNIFGSSRSASLRRSSKSLFMVEEQSASLSVPSLHNSSSMDGASVSRSPSNPSGSTEDSLSTHVDDNREEDSQETSSDAHSSSPIHSLSLSDNSAGPSDASSPISPDSVEPESTGTSREPQHAVTPEISNSISHNDLSFLQPETPSPSSASLSFDRRSAALPRYTQSFLQNTPPRYSSSSFLSSFAEVLKVKEKARLFQGDAGDATRECSYAANDRTGQGQQSIETELPLAAQLGEGEANTSREFDGDVHINQETQEFQQNSYLSDMSNNPLLPVRRADSTSQAIVPSNNLSMSIYKDLPSMPLEVQDAIDSSPDNSLSPSHPRSPPFVFPLAPNTSTTQFIDTVPPPGTYHKPTKPFSPPTRPSSIHKPPPPVSFHSHPQSVANGYRPRMNGPTYGPPLRPSPNYPPPAIPPSTMPIIPPIHSAAVLENLLGTDNLPRTTEINTLPCAGVRLLNGPLAWRLVVSLPDKSYEKPTTTRGVAKRAIKAVFGSSRQRKLERDRVRFPGVETYKPIGGVEGVGEFGRTEKLSMQKLGSEGSGPGSIYGAFGTKGWNSSTPLLLKPDEAVLDPLTKLEPPQRRFVGGHTRTYTDPGKERPQLNGTFDGAHSAISSPHLRVRPLGHAQHTRVQSSYASSTKSSSGLYSIASHSSTTLTASDTLDHSRFFVTPPTATPFQTSPPSTPQTHPREVTVNFTLDTSLSTSLISPATLRALGYVSQCKLGSAVAQPNNLPISNKTPENNANQEWLRRDLPSVTYEKTRAFSLDDGDGARDGLLHGKNATPLPPSKLSLDAQIRSSTQKPLHTQTCTCSAPHVPTVGTKMLLMVQGVRAAFVVGQEGEAGRLGAHWLEEARVSLCVDQGLAVFSLERSFQDVPRTVNLLPNAAQTLPQRVRALFGVGS